MMMSTDRELLKDQQFTASKCCIYTTC